MSSSARSTVSGRPISLLCDPAGATVAPTATSTWAMRSLVDVLPEDPVTPTTVQVRQPVERPLRARRPRAAWGSGDHDAAAPAARAGRAPADRTEPLDRLDDEVVAVDPLALDGDEQPAGLDGARVAGRRSVTIAVGSPACSVPADRCGDLVQRHRDHRAATADRRSNPRRTSRSSNGTHHAGDLLALLVALARDDDGVTGGRRAATAAAMALARSGSTTISGTDARREPLPRLAAWPRGSRAGPRTAGCRSSGRRRRRAPPRPAPISGRLCGSRSPPQPRTTTTRPVVTGRGPPRAACATASGVCA